MSSNLVDTGQLLGSHLKEVELYQIHIPLSNENPTVVWSHSDSHNSIMYICEKRWIFSHF